MKFIANENFPGPSITLLREKHINIISIAEDYQGITDEEVMKIAAEEGRTILTHDADYGELIFKRGYKPESGVIYFRIFEFEPTDPARILIDVLKQKLNFKYYLTVIDAKSIRQRKF